MSGFFYDPNENKGLTPLYKEWILDYKRSINEGLEEDDVDLSAELDSIHDRRRASMIFHDIDAVRYYDEIAAFLTRSILLNSAVLSLN